MYLVTCKYCESPYESKVNRSGVCPDCKAAARTKKSSKYQEKTYDRVTFYVPKGQKAQLKEFLAVRGMSMNEFINAAIGEKLKSIEENEQKKR